MASETIPTRTVQDVRAHAVTRDGIKVLVQAYGPNVRLREKILARRNNRKWNRGLRPDRDGNWR